MVTMTQLLRLAGFGACALALSACGAGERLNALNPFSGEETDDPNAPAASERISVLAFEQTIERSDQFGQPIDLPGTYTNDRWPQPDGYPSHAMQHTAAAGDLNRVWRARAGQGSARDRRINARPVVLDNVIYAIDAEGRISAHNAETGDRLWDRRIQRNRVETQNDDGGGFGLSFIPFVGGSGGGGADRMAFGGGIAVDGGRVYAHRGAEFVVALDAGTGEEIWRQTAFTPFHSAPTVSDGRVFLTTDDNELFAIDATSGEVLWTHRGISESARLLTAPSPAVYGEIVIAPYSSGELVALRVSNGSVLWSDSLTRTGGLTPMSTINDISGSPVVTNDRVYAMSHSGILAAFNLNTGERIWTQEIGGLHVPWLVGDYLYLITTEAELVALDRHTGQLRWLTELGAFRNAEKRRQRIAWAGPIMAGGRLVIGSSRGSLLLVDASTGEIMGDRDVGEAVFVPPVIADQTVYVLSDDGRLSAYR
ncbi:outer membrane protein assembly factor BamB family protein [Marinicauda sp. Alg238-R41]|uniref:outer membrane protein assembly factor BamB family protein n=1 Tax=Marinicauda sp. Alg238-R41 TaxID=2993447 RepID=UPI0022E4FCB3|nr:PQQ-binding-like beta-propeller repeat protein [Marinicauda sp. Alg238-R41]